MTQRTLEKGHGKHCNTNIKNSHRRTEKKTLDATKKIVTKGQKKQNEEGTENTWKKTQKTLITERRREPK